MSLRNEQCNKVCRILDEVLANRPTERDTLIVAVRKAFGALESERKWMPCSERLPEKEGNYLMTAQPTYNHAKDIRIAHWSGRWVGYVKSEILAWMPLPEPYREEGEQNDGI